MINSDDPTEIDYWGPLLDLQAALDAQIASIYTDHGHQGVRTRFAYPMIRLAHRGPMTISELAQSLGQTHSAVSQTVMAMRNRGLVDSVPGTDARTKVVALTEEGTALIPFLEAEWRATEAAIAELDDELPSGLHDYVRNVNERLQKRSFADRIKHHLSLSDIQGDASESHQ